MIVLAADTATSINTVAVCDGSRILAETLVECGRRHSECLLATVDWVLSEAGIGMRDLEGLAISIGPGSFTGLRVGAATWKGLAHALGLPLVPVPTLDAMSCLTPLWDGSLCVLLDARMREVFGAAYVFAAGYRTKVVPDCVCSVDMVLDQVPGNSLFAGNGADLYRSRIVERLPDARFAAAAVGIPRASAVAAEAEALLAAGVDTRPASVAPIYLRQSQAEINRAIRKASAS